MEKVRNPIIFIIIMLLFLTTLFAFLPFSFTPASAGGVAYYLDIDMLSEYVSINSPSYLLLFNVYDLASDYTADNIALYSLREQDLPYDGFLIGGLETGIIYYCSVEIVEYDIPQGWNSDYINPITGQLHDYDFTFELRNVSEFISYTPFAFEELPQFTLPDKYPTISGIFIGASAFFESLKDSALVFFASLYYGSITEIGLVYVSLFGLCLAVLVIVFITKIWGNF